MTRLIDLDQTVFVPIVDETNGGFTYEREMTLSEFFDECLPDFKPEIVDAIPVKWLNERHRKACSEADCDMMDAITNLCNEYHFESGENEHD